MAGESRIAQALGSRQIQRTGNLQVGSAANYNAANIQPDQFAGQRESQLAKAFGDVGTIVQQGTNLIQQSNKRKEEEFNPMVERYLNEHGRVGFRKLMLNNEVPEMEDPIFRKVLYKTLGTQAAFDIDREMSDMLSSGKLDTLTQPEIFELRAERVAKIRDNLWDDYNITNGDPTFSEGLASQIVQRNQALSAAYMDRRSAIARNQAKASFTEGANQLIRSDIPEAGKALGAYMVNGYLDGLSGDVNQTQGFVAQVTAGMAMQGYPKEELEAFWNTTLEDGTTLGSLLDAENQQKYTELAESRRLGFRVENRTKLNDAMNRLEFSEDTEMALQEVRQLKSQVGKAQGGFASNEYAQLEALEKRILNGQAQALDKQKVQIQKDAVKAETQEHLKRDMLARAEGSDVNFSPNYYNASKEDKAAAAQAVNQMIDDDPAMDYIEKYRRKARLASGDPDGYFAEAMKTQELRSASTLKTLAAGQPLSEEQEKELSTMLGFVKELPSEAAQQLDPDSYRQFTWMNRARELGLPQTDVAKAMLDVIESDKRSPELMMQRRQEFQQAATQDPKGLAKMINNMDARTEEDAREYWSILRTSGMSPAQAASETNKYIKDNYYTLSNSKLFGEANSNIVIPNQWLALDARPDEIKLNQDFLTAQIQEKFGSDSSSLRITKGGTGEDDDPAVLTIRDIAVDGAAGTHVLLRSDFEANYDLQKQLEAEGYETQLREAANRRDEDEAKKAQIERRNDWNIQRREASERRAEKRQRKKYIQELRYRKAAGTATQEQLQELERLANPLAE